MENDIEKPFGTYFLSPILTKFLLKAQSMPVTWLGRRLALIFRKITLKQTYGIIDAIVCGLKFRFYMNDNVSERKFLFMPQFFDRLERDLIRDNLPKDGIAIDIGANAGIYSMTMASLLGDEGKVIAIEPNPKVLDRLKFNSALNGFDKLITFEQSGVSDKEGRFDLIMDETNLGGSSLVVERSDKKITVSCHLLLSILKMHNINKIDALKIDIEGAEDKALIPFFKNADKELYPKLIILEHSPNDWEDDLPTVLKSSGYKLVKITRMNQIWIIE